MRSNRFFGTRCLRYDGKMIYRPCFGLILFPESVKIRGESYHLDFTKYANVPFAELMPDFFVPDNTPLPDEVKNS